MWALQWEQTNKTYMSGSNLSIWHDAGWDTKIRQP